MDYLREHNMVESLTILEKEAQLSLYKYSKEVQFLRELIIDGQWIDADGFIKTIFENLLGGSPDNGANNSNQDAQNKSDLFNLNQINFQIKKQIYLELLNSNDLENNQNYVIELIKEMELLSISKQAHFDLCNLLNYPKLQNHPDYADWNVPYGRFQCFDMIKNMLAECHSISIGSLNSDIEKRRAP